MCDIRILLSYEKDYVKMFYMCLWLIFLVSHDCISEQTITERMGWRWYP